MRMTRICSRLGLPLSLFALVSTVVPRQSGPPSGARMFIRYEQGQGYNRLGESLQALEHPIRSDDRSFAAIRLCSKKGLAVALATAAADPFLIADRLEAFGYPRDRILFLRSEDCLSRDESRPATEVWTIPDKAPLPSNVDAFKSSQVRLIPLGRKPGRLGMSDYKSALSKLIQNLRANPSSTGTVIGYVLHKPSPALRRRMSEATRALEKSGISGERYLVRLMYWPDEFSEHPPDPEARYPNVSVIELLKGSN